MPEGLPLRLLVCLDRVNVSGHKHAFAAAVRLQQPQPNISVATGGSAAFHRCRTWAKGRGEKGPKGIETRVTTPLNQKITTMAVAAATAFGVALVVARFSGQQGRSTLQILLENPDGSSPDVETCAKVSRLLSAQLDVAELIGGRYTLEVSSAGLDRPLLSAAECARFVGKHAAFKFKNPLDLNGKPLGATKGVIGAVTGDDVTLQAEGTQLRFNFHQVQSAELAPTDAEMAAFMGFKAKPARGTPHPLSARAKQLNNPQS